MFKRETKIGSKEEKSISVNDIRVIFVFFKIKKFISENQLADTEAGGTSSSGRDTCIKHRSM